MICLLYHGKHVDEKYIEKNGVCRGIPIFVSFVPKHRLWLLQNIDCGYSKVYPQSKFSAKIRKISKFFYWQFSFFKTLKISWATFRNTQNLSLSLQDLQCTLLIALIGAFCYTIDAGRIRRDGRWTGGLDTDLRNGQGTVTGNIGYKNGGFSANGHYTETFGRGQDSWGASAGYNRGGFTSGVEYSGTRGYESVSGHVGYQRGNFNVRGTGFRDSTGNWGAGATLGYRFRRSLDTETEVEITLF